MEVATGISIVALAISGGTFVRQLYKDRWEKKRHVEVEGRSGIVARPSGERLEIIGMRVVNRNPRYPIRETGMSTEPQPPMQLHQVERLLV
jgi:hypothetical protein